MDFFLPASFQKRILRFALTYLDFVETDDLDLDKLDITLGQRSVIELKNVGLRIQVCQALFVVGLLGPMLTRRIIEAIHDSQTATNRHP